MIEANNLQNDITSFLKDTPDNEFIELVKYVTYGKGDPNSIPSKLTQDFIAKFIGPDIWRNIVIDSRQPIMKSSINQRNIFRFVVLGLMVESFNRLEKIYL